MLLKIEKWKESDNDKSKIKINILNIEKNIMKQINKQWVL